MVASSGGTASSRRSILLISAGWFPPDLCPSRSCLALGSDIAMEMTVLNDHEGSPVVGDAATRSGRNVGIELEGLLSLGE
jgi:hypothetical protein